MVFKLFVVKIQQSIVALSGLFRLEFYPASGTLHDRKIFRLKIEGVLNETNQ